MEDSQPWCVPVAAGPCSRACLPPPVQPCPGSWEALDVDFGGVSFPGSAPLTQQCHDAALASHTGLSHRSLSRRRRRGMAVHVLLHAQSLTWCLRAALGAAGQGNGFLLYVTLVSCVRVARDAINWKAMVAVHCTWCCFGFCTGIAHQWSYLQFWCQWKWQWLTSVCAGLAIWHYHFILHFLLLGLFSACSWGGAQRKTNESRRVIPRKKISLYDGIQIT